MMEAECPSCGESIEVGRKPKMGQRVVCPGCDVELEVVWLDPLELDWPAEEYEGYEDDEDDEDW